MKLAMQIISNDQTVKNDTVQGLKGCNWQSVATQAKKGEHLGSMMPVIKKAFSIMVDDILELSTENEFLKSKIGSYDEKWMEESKAKLLN